MYYPIHFVRQKIIVKTTLPFDSIYKHIETCHIYMYQCNQPVVNTCILYSSSNLNKFTIPELIYARQIKQAFSFSSFCVAKK